MSAVAFSVPSDGMSPCCHRFRDKCPHFLPRDIEDREVNCRFARKGEIYCRTRIERIGEIGIEIGFVGEECLFGNLLNIRMGIDVGFRHALPDLR